MASTFTPNFGVEKPGSGDYVGTWDSPLNSDLQIYDQALGTAVTIPCSAGGSITLSTAQARSAFLNFSGDLTASVVITIPTLSSDPGTTLSGRKYAVQNYCGNSSAYTVTLISTIAGTQFIAIPPQDIVDVMLVGTGGVHVGAVKFCNLGPVGSYLDIGGSSLPNWISACQVAPYLNCDGTTFSSAVYPALTTILGGTTLPDARGRFRATLNQGQSRITSGSSTGGVDGNTILASGGAQTTTLSSQNMPPVLITDPGHTHTYTIAAGGGSVIGGGGISAVSTSVTGSNVTGITAGNASPTNFSNIPPAYISGLTLIRAA